MRKFFGGWKRKLGVVTLLLACLFMGGWFRSSVNTDQLTIRVDDHTVYWIISGSHVLGWIQVHSEDAFPETVKTRWEPWAKSPFSAVYTIWWKDNGSARTGGSFTKSTARPNTHLIIPYPVIVLPLTALSAWLLLSKPRFAKHREPQITPPN
ncbi:hypothetical protein [Schlesneria paludicola]|uniref:hypothetical protein n=1 Tax=Schlesneria paludicola TaxID=360056 RepID=UPI00029AD0C0|nr:hypothetical protein [Schlesneria paludicola]